MNGFNCKTWSDALPISVMLQGPGMRVVFNSAGMGPSSHKKER